ncbi:MAG: HEAT repeat domain-containing protein, partial [Alphaproteobacteria bacterium]
CQEVCPWNGSEPGADRPDFSPRLADVLAIDDGGFDGAWGTSALRRAGRVRLARNAAVALGNGGQPGAVPVLARAIASHDAPLVRGHAAWAMGRLPDGGGVEGRRSLENALRDPDATVRAEAESALDDRRP